MSETTEGVVTLVTDDDVTKYVVDSKSKTNDDEWHFVAGQREGATLRIYIDGQLEGTTAATATYSLAGTKQHNAYIGAITDHTNNVLYKLYNGLIDDVRIYNKALSEARDPLARGPDRPGGQAVLSWSRAARTIARSCESEQAASVAPAGQPPEPLSFVPLSR